MSTSIRILRNASAEWFATAASMIVGILLVPFLITQLGKDAYGLLGLIGSLAFLTTIAGFGLSGALSRHLAEQIARNDSQTYNELSSTAFYYYIGSGLLVAATLAILAPIFVDLFNVPDALTNEAIWLVRWYCSLSAFMTLVQSLFQGVITSHNAFAVLNLTNAFSNVTRAVLLFVVISIAAGLVSWSLAMLAIQAVNLAMIIAIAYRICPTLRLKRTLCSVRAFHKLFGLGGKLFLIQLSRILGMTVDPLILSFYLGPGSVAVYAPAASLAGVVRPLVDTLSQQLHPLATSYYVNGSKGNLESVLLRGTRLSFLMGIGASVFLFVFAVPIMDVWLRDSLGAMYIVSAVLLAMWALVDLAAYSGGSQWPVLLGSNHVEFLLWVQLTTAILNIALSIYLVGYTRLGIVGVMVPTVLVGFVRRPILVIYTARLCGVSVRNYFSKSYLSGLRVLLLLLSVSLLLRETLHPDSLAALAAVAVLYGICWMLLTWCLGLEAEDRMVFDQMLRRAITGQLTQR